MGTPLLVAESRVEGFDHLTWPPTRISSYKSPRESVNPCIEGLTREQRTGSKDWIPTEVSHHKYTWHRYTSRRSRTTGILSQFIPSSEFSEPNGGLLNRDHRLVYTFFIKLSPRAQTALPVPVSTLVSAPIHWLGLLSAFPREIFSSEIRTRSYEGTPSTLYSVEIPIVYTGEKNCPMT